MIKMLLTKTIYNFSLNSEFISIDQTKAHIKARERIEVLISAKDKYLSVPVHIDK